MNLSEFLAKTTNVDVFEDLFPSASGARSTWWGTQPIYRDNQSWEEDFGPVCRKPEGEPSNEYERATRRSIDEFLAANPHITLPSSVKSSA